MIDLSKVPNKPGVYIFKDSNESILYIGKATNLKSRVASYFNTLTTDRPWVNRMLPLVASISTILTSNAHNALILEDKLIKQHQPKYNIRQTDDKTYPYLMITTTEQFPRVLMTRKKLDDGNLYFGPYVSSGEINKIILFVRQVFGVHSGKSVIAQKYQRPCFYCQLDGNLCPLAGQISQKEYGKNVKRVVELLSNKRHNIIKVLTRELNDASRGQFYEKAGKLRDLIFALKNKARTNAELSTVVSGEYPNIAMSLKEWLGLDYPPSRVEAVDISNYRELAVGTTVCFILGEVEKNEYRRYKIKTVKGRNDFAMIKEVAHRRLSDKLRDLPDLLLIDGGKEQLKSAIAGMPKGLNVPIISIAKKPDRIFVADGHRPLVVGKHEESMKFLSNVRDEVHRFSIKYSREKKLKEFLR